MRALFLLLFSLPAWGATWFVRNLGDCANNGDGTATDCAASGGAAGAFRGPGNINAASVNPGDTVVLLGPITQSASWLTNDTGSAGLPITYTGDGSAWGWPARATITNTGGAYNVSTTSGSYLTFTKIDALGGNTGDCWAIGTSGASTESNINIVDVSAANCATDGIDIKGTTASGIALDGVSISNVASNGLVCFVSGTQGNDILIEDSGTAGADNNHDGLGPNDGCDNSVWTNITVRRQKSDLGAGIDLQDSTGTGGITLRGAYIEGGDGAGFTSVCNAGTQTFDASSVIVNGARLNVYLKDCGGLHNLSHFTTYGGRTAELKLGDSGTSGDSLTAVVKNSSFGGAACVGQAVQYRDNASVTITTDYNQYCPGGEYSMTAAGTQTFATWKTAASQDANSIAADPQFLGGANPTTAEGFCLQASSPLVGAGIPVSAKYDYKHRRFNTPPSIGACELGGKSRLPSLSVPFLELH